MKVAILTSLLVGLMLTTGATALALVNETVETVSVSEPALRPVDDLSSRPVAQAGLAVVNGMEIKDPNPTCGVPFTVHVNVANQSGLTSQPGTVTLQNIHRGTGNVNYTGYQNYPDQPPGGNYVVVFQVLVNSYISEGQQLNAFTNGSTFSLKYDIKRGNCPKTSSSAPPPSTTGQSLQVQHSGKCIDVPGGSQNAITAVQQFSCTGSNNQSWAVESVGGGYYRIISRFSGMCLDVQGFSQQPQAIVQQFPCNGGDNQSFTFSNLGNGYNLIIAKHSGLCLDVRGASTADMAPIQQFTCKGSANQQWRSR